MKMTVVEAVLLSAALMQAAAAAPATATAAVVAWLAAAAAVIDSCIKLTKSGFSCNDVTAILQGSKRTSVIIIKALCDICLSMYSQQKAFSDIVYFVRQGRNDENRKKVTKVFMDMAQC
jgi:hypothetical protein